MLTIVTPELMMKGELMQEGQSKRIWKETLAPKYLHDVLGVYRGILMPDMDRCWLSNDGYQVTSRIISTDWGKVEHAAIQIINDNAFLSANGERDIPWAVKQQIKNELFGEKRLAIEVFPKQKNLVDVQDVYHLWVFPKDFDLPFGIHPIRDKQCKAISRGCPKDAGYLIENTRQMRDICEILRPSAYSGFLRNVTCALNFFLSYGIPASARAWRRFFARVSSSGFS